jgi:hypothetical protein
MIDAQRDLVIIGWHPSIAGKLVLRAANRLIRARESGLGIQQTRSLRRDLDPTIAPRQIISGEQCVRIQEIPGDETGLYQRLEDYRNRGYNVMEVEPTKGFPSVRVYWACPPGRVPMEAQQQVLQSEAWGAPLYSSVRVP